MTLASRTCANTHTHHTHTHTNYTHTHTHTHTHTGVTEADLAPLGPPVLARLSAFVAGHVQVKSELAHKKAELDQIQLTFGTSLFILPYYFTIDFLIIFISE